MIRLRIQPSQLAGAVLMASGAALLAYVAVILGAGSWMESRDRMKLAASFTQGVPLLAMRDPRNRAATSVQDGPNIVPVSTAAPPHRYPAPLGLGIVEIDRLGLAVLVRASTNSADLDKGAGWISGSALPGDAGNVAIAGHRDTFFRRLREVQLGDQVRLQSPSGLKQYKVTEIMIVEPSDTRVLRPTRDSVLTLVTCYPFDAIGSAPKRYIVRAASTSAP